MLVVPNSIMAFQTGDVLSPTDLTRHYDQINDWIKDIGSQRFAHTPLTYQLVQDAGTPLTDSDYSTDVERCRIRFAVPTGKHAEISGAYVFANYSASNGLDGYLLKADGTPPSGVINPIFQLGALASVSDTATTATSLTPILCDDAQEYYLELRPGISGGTFSIERCDITFNVKTDRFDFGQLNTLDDVDYRFTEADPPDATRVASINTAVTTAVSALNTNQTRYQPTLFCWNNVSNGSSANILRVDLPAGKTSSVGYSIGYAVFWAVATASTTATVSVKLLDTLGLTLKTQTIALTSAKFGSSGVTAYLLGHQGSNGASDTSQDYRFTVSTTAGTMFKVYGLVWTGP